MTGPDFLSQQCLLASSDIHYFNSLTWAFALSSDSDSLATHNGNGRFSRTPTPSTYRSFYFCRSQTGIANHCCRLFVRNSCFDYFKAHRDIATDNRRRNSDGGTSPLAGP